MGKYEKLLDKISEGRADASIRFKDLRQPLLRLGFVERIRDSHHLYRHPETGARLNIQPAGSMAKPYQIKEIRSAIIKLKNR